MIFNSIAYLIFLPFVCALYWMLGYRRQNLLLLAASYIFYGWWDLRFLFLIVLSTAVDFYAGLMIEGTQVTRPTRLLVTAFTLAAAIGFVGIDWNDATLCQETWAWYAVVGTGVAVLAANLSYTRLRNWQADRRRRFFLIMSMMTNLGLLATFKYFNFFMDSAEQAVTSLGIDFQVLRLEVVLPVGISFYTFQTMSYTIDVYRGNLKATDRFLDFALFVSYFPQLVAGPIERAAHLLPALQRPRQTNVDEVTRGLFLLLLGFFKKVGIADGIAGSVNSIYESTAAVGQLDVALATVLFALQIYCDFSGYSDIARGTSKLLGIDLMTNFNVPYFSRSPSEFWARWHISLSSWLRDYLYFSLGGNRFGTRKTFRNLMITMLLGGLWHGAAWNFIIWGAYQGTILCAYRLLAPRERAGFIMRATQMAFFFLLTCYGWLIFRATSSHQIAAFTTTLLTEFGYSPLQIMRPTLPALVGIPLLVVFDSAQYVADSDVFYRRWPSCFRGLLYALMFVVILMGTSNAPVQFIYFQF